MEAPLPSVGGRRPVDGAQGVELDRLALGASIEPDLAAVITEFDCFKTLETGFGRGTAALAIARIHEQRGRGGHIAIDPSNGSVFSSDGIEGLRRAGLLPRVQIIASGAQVALPELLRDGFETDFALIQGPKRFEDAFTEFLYLDRMLVPGGIMAFVGAEERSVSAVLEFIARARAYEVRSQAGADFAVLRKLGRQRAERAPFPSRWGRSGDHPEPEGNFVTQNGAGSVADLRRGGVTSGTVLKASSTRELHLARARAAEREVRIADLGTCLLDAEQRAAELLRTRARLGQVELALQQSRHESDRLHDQLSLSEAAHERAEHWLTVINSSASWRLTAPLRSAMTLARRLFGR